MRALALAAVLAGCAVGPSFVRPEAPKVPAYTPPSATTTSFPLEVGARVESAWWHHFGNQTLDAIVAESLAKNPGVEAARSALEMSRHQASAAYGPLFPQVDARAGVTHQRYNPAPGVIPANTFTLFTASASVSYALDIWGGARRALEGVRAAVDAQRATLRGAQVMLASNVVDAVIARASYLAQMRAIESLLALQTEQLRIVRAQAAGGTVPKSNVLAIESEMASTRASLAPLAQKADATEHLVATLAGRTPGEWMMPALGLDELTLPSSLPLSLPSELVRQRPDILVAEAQLHAANAQIGVATAAMLPSLTLTGSYGTTTQTANTLFSPAAAVWGVGAGLTQPILHGGTLYEQRRAAIDARNQTAALYRQTVLTAFAQVADTLRALEHDGEAYAADADAARAAAEALALLQANYQAGIATYLQVIVADEQYIETQVAFVQATAQRLMDAVALYVALGGGWWT